MLVVVGHLGCDELEGANGAGLCRLREVSPLWLEPEMWKVYKRAKCGAPYCMGQA